MQYNIIVYNVKLYLTTVITDGYDTQSVLWVKGYIKAIRILCIAYRIIDYIIILNNMHII